MPLDDSRAIFNLIAKLKGSLDLTVLLHIWTTNKLIWMWCRVWKVNLLGEANLKAVCKVYQKGDPSEYHLTRTHRPTSATTTILTWSSYSQAIFLDKFRDREYKKPVLGVEAKKFCRRNILLMKNSTIESSFWKEIISYWYFFFLIKSSLIYKELCQKKKKKMKKKKKKKSWQHLIYNVSRLS